MDLRKNDLKQINECPLVSIIVPVYNVDRYINQCVDSIINQTYKNIELILVDDGSTDNSPNICDEYAKTDARIKVIHKKNGGLSSAREIGIDNSTGEYVMFIDGDDWLDEETILSCVDCVYKDRSVDLVSFPYVREYKDKSFPVHFFDGNKRFDGKDAENFYRQLFGPCGKECNKPEQIDKLVSCCMKLYRADVVKAGKFFDTKEVGSCEDGLFNMYALYKCTRVVYLDNCFYHYRKTRGTLTSSYRENFIAKWNRLFDLIENIITEKNLGDEYRFALNNRIAFSCLGIGFNEFSDKTRSFNKHRKVIARYINSDRYKASVKRFTLKYLPIKWKVFMFCCKHKLAFSVSILLSLMIKVKGKVK